MEAEARYTYVGVAVLALLAALAAGVVWLKYAGGRDSFNFYTIYFERQPLDGLQIGADVDMRGIKVGRVEDYALLPANINRVRVTIRIDRRAPVSTNTDAIVTRNFVTGIARISLVTPQPPGPQLVAIRGDENERFPVIPEGESDLDAIAGRINRLGEMAGSTLDRLNEVLRPDNRAAFDATLRNLRDLTAALNARMKELDRTLVSFSTAAGQLGDASSEVAQLARSAGAELTPALRQADRTMKDVSAAADALKAQTASLSTQLAATTAGLDDQLTVAVIDLRATVDSLNRVLERLQDPRAALLGPSPAQRGPGE